MLLLGIELLNMRLEGQCLNHWAIWVRILHQQKILNKNNFTYRGIFAIYTHKQLVVLLKAIYQVIVLNPTRQI